MTQPTLSVVSPVFNEAEGIKQFVDEIKAVVEKMQLSGSFEHIVIDNCSTDGTTDILEQLARKNKTLKVIVNSKNFGVSQSGFHVTTQATGKAVIYIHSDFEDPIELIPELFSRWQNGAMVVMCKKKSFVGNQLLAQFRKLFYAILDKCNPYENITGFTGFGLCDEKIISLIKAYAPNQPFLRGLIAKYGYDFEVVDYTPNTRRYSVSKNTLSSITAEAVNGLFFISARPLKMISATGFVTSVVSMLISVGYLLYKLLFWEQFDLGVAPILVGLTLLFCINFMMLGIMSEYIAQIHSNINREQPVTERKRINF